MDRRDTLKSLFVGTLAGGALLATGCKTESEEKVETQEAKYYGRTPEEVIVDAALHAEQYFNEHEMETLAVLCDLILPATADFGSATSENVPEFIEFMAKDIPSNQLPLRGGLMWLDNYSNRQFDKEFKVCAINEQKRILDEIAYPDDAKPEVERGVLFFSRLRNMTLTGYYTSQTGIKDLGYKGNVANVWDGVPQDILDQHGLAYEPEWLAKCIDQSKRNEVAVWDEDGNLVS